MWKPQFEPSESYSHGRKWLGSRAAVVYVSGQQALTSGHDVTI